jgi:sortase (surface protein transpeptidase)
MAPQSRVSTSAASPTHLRIPAINVATDVTSLGLNDDNTVEVPDEPNEAGWFNQGPVPGVPGSAVILGHVDSTYGPAVFYRLRHLEPGDRIHVRLSDGDTAHFAVARLATYANENFPAKRVYAGSPRRPALNLVTCGGAYDPDAGGYQANVVVYTTYLHTTPSTI